jgi:hypothetical protein
MDFYFMILLVVFEDNGAKFRLPESNSNQEYGMDDEIYATDESSCSQ